MGAISTQLQPKLVAFTFSSFICVIRFTHFSSIETELLWGLKQTSTPAVINYYHRPINSSCPNCMSTKMSKQAILHLTFLPPVGNWQD